MARFNYFKRLTKATIQNIQTLNNVRRNQNDLILNRGDNAAKSVHVNERLDVHVFNSLKLK